MTRPGRWEHVITDAGHHLRLVGANGEIVMTTEVYEDARSCAQAFSVAERTFSQVVLGLPEVVDERTKET